MRSFERYAMAPARLFRVYDGPVAPEGRHRVFSYGMGCLAMWWIRAGEVSLLSQGSAQIARAGQLVLVGIGESRQDFSDDSQILSINYTWNEEQGRPFFAQQGVWIGREGCAGLQNAAAALAQSVSRHFGNPSPHLPIQPLSATSYFEIHAAFSLWLMELSSLMERHGVPRSDERQIDPRVEKARCLLESAPMDKLPDYERIALEAGLSRAHLERLYRAEYHLSPHGAFELRRLEFTRSELLRENAVIKKISLELGFKHLSRFSNWFSQKEGISPRGFREQRSRILC